MTTTRRMRRERRADRPLPVETWQVWNVANKDVPPRTYGTLLEATYQTIKLADPGADVLTGAIAYGGGKKASKPVRFPSRKRRVFRIRR